MQERYVLCFMCVNMSPSAHTIYMQQAESILNLVLSNQPRGQNPNTYAAITTKIIQQQTRDPKLNTYHTYSCSPLQYAILRKVDLKIIEALIFSGQDINAKFEV